MLLSTHENVVNGGETCNNKWYVTQNVKKMFEFSTFVNTFIKLFCMTSVNSNQDGQPLCNRQPEREL